MEEPCQWDLQPRATAPRCKVPELEFDLFGARTAPVLAHSRGSVGVVVVVAAASAMPSFGKLMQAFRETCSELDDGSDE